VKARASIQTLFVLGFAVVSLLFTAGSALAQPEILIADVPFSFMVENTTLPAGTYEIQEVDPWEFVLSNAKGDVKVTFVTEPAERLSRASVGELIFNEYGGRHFLAKMWFPGAVDGYALTKTRTERALMKMTPPPIKTVPLKKK
jgi:hypothetical protein